MENKLMFESNERLVNLRNHLGLGRDEFSLKIGIKSGQLANIELKKQKMPAWYIEAVGKFYPEYEYWLSTGKTKPEVGFISPDLEKIKENIKQAG